MKTTNKPIVFLSEIFKKTNRKQSFLTFSTLFALILLVCLSSNFISIGNFGQDANLYQRSSMYAMEINDITKLKRNYYNTLNWATLNTVEVSNNVEISKKSSSSYSRIAMAPVRLSIEQVRNGSATSPSSPVVWQNGNAGASNAHYVEGWSIPYRVIMSDLPNGGMQSIDIEWDTKHSGANAIDFITDYDLLDFPVGSHATNFNHSPETINPAVGYTINTGPSKVQIPEPTFSPNPGPNPLGTFNAIKVANLGRMTIWNGSIVSMEYISQGPLNNATASTRLRIHFTNTTGTVIIAWGGHIAKATDWGQGNSASAVSGSPYHSRIIEWDPGDDGINPVSVGNQDRSLSAAAVIDPPPCDVTGPTLVCPSSTGHVYQNNAATDPNIIPSGFTYEWSITGNGSISGSTSGAKVTVNAGGTCGANYTVTLTIKTSNGTFVTSCFATFSVSDTTAPALNGTIPSGQTGINGCKANAPTGPSEATIASLYSDACGGDITVVKTGAPTGTDCAWTVTYNYTVKDKCSNFATAVNITYSGGDTTAPALTGTIPSGQTGINGCKANAPTGPSEATIAGLYSDLCGGDITVVKSGSPTGTDCAWTVTYNYTVRDKCSNFATAVNITYSGGDDTDPVITFCPADVTIECDASISPADTGEATATDNCSSVTPTYSDESIPNGCQEIITRTWTAEDVCGNSVSCVQTIIIRDRTAPVITCPGKGDTASTATAIDNCSDEIDIKIFSRDSGTTRTWTAIDESGNISTCTHDISPIEKSVSEVATEKNKTIASEDLTTIKAYPNPFNNNVSFKVESMKDTEGSLELFNMLGQRVMTVYNGKINAGTRTFEVNLPSRQTTTLIYVLRLGEERITGKLIQLKR